MHEFVYLSVCPLMIACISSCHASSTAQVLTDDFVTVMPTSTSTVPAVPKKKIVSQVIVSDWLMNSALGENFGWLPNGQIYYGIQQGDLSNWIG